MPFHLWTEKHLLRMLIGGEGLLRLTHAQQNLFTSPDSLKG